MNLKRLSFPPIEIIAVEKWLTAGVSHGFLGAGVDSRGDRERCDELVRAFCKSSSPVYRLRQTHSTAICEPPAVQPEGDGWFISRREQPGVFGIETADCAPVLLLAKDLNYAAAIHCGWRGATAGLLLLTLERFKTARVELASVEMCIGPCAGDCCYEVGDDVVKIVQDQWHGEGLTRRGDKTFFNLSGLLSSQALHAGLTKEQIAVWAECTICNLHFFSYRRQKALAGRQLSFISSV